MILLAPIATWTVVVVVVGYHNRPSVAKMARTELEAGTATMADFPTAIRKWSIQKSAEVKADHNAMKKTECNKYELTDTRRRPGRVHGMTAQTTTVNVLHGCLAWTSFRQVTALILPMMTGGEFMQALWSLSYL